MARILPFLLFPLIWSTQGIPPLQEHLGDFGNLDSENIHENGASVFVTDRLPNSINPKVVKLEIRPILEEGTETGERWTAPGKIWVTGPAIDVVNTITLNAKNIEINSTTLAVTDSMGNSIPVISGQAEEAKEFYNIQLASNLVVGRNYTVYIEFVSKIYTDESIALYASFYKSADGSTKYLVSTDFEAPDARMAFPCWDEPHFKASWDIEIIRQSHFHSLSNMNLINTSAVPELPGWHRDVFARTLPMSSYLVCFAVSDFKSESANTSLYSKPVTIWGPPDAIDRGAGKFSPDFSAKVMHFFEQYYEVEYTFPKMDKISIPDFSSGAMENWGLNTYRDTRLLYEQGISTAQDMFSMTNTISHELVHQWWGNLVTCAWWNDLWIQEGAATYYAPIAIQAIGMADLLPIETLITSTVQRSLEFDANMALTHPIHNDGVDPANVAVLFDSLSYYKGASLIRMMVSFLTSNNYNFAMTTFLNRYSYDVADQFQLFAVLDEFVVDNGVANLLPAGVTVEDVMRGWTLQAGYPLVKVERDPFTDTATLTQEKYYSRISQDDGSIVRWHIPVSIQRQGSPIVTLPERWILSNQSSISIRPVRGDWFIVNPQTHGYYRVQYANDLLDAIIAQLKSNHNVFDVQVRSSLVDDNLNLAYAGYLDLNKALDLTLYLKNERELFPWQSFFTNMALPYRVFGRSSSYMHFKNYILNLTADALEAINIEPIPGDANPTILLRSRIVEWRCNLGDAECIRFANYKFANWLMNPGNPSEVFPDLQPMVYCTAIANGGDVPWDFIWNQYLNSDRDVMQTNLLRALACSKTTFRLNNLLEMAIAPNSGILNKHRTLTIQAVAGNSNGVNLAFTFLKNNYETIIRRFGAGTVNSVITTLSTQFNTALERDDLQKFATAAGLSLSPAVQENLAKNIDWVNNHFAIFTNFIRNL